MAAGDALRCVRNAAYRITFPLRDTSHALVTGATGLNAFVSLDSAAYGSPAATVTEIGSSGTYTLDLTAAELTTDTNAAIYVTSADAWAFYADVPFEDSPETGVAQAATSTTVRLRAGASATDDLHNGMQVEILRGTGVGQTRTITAYNGTNKDATVDRAWITNPDTTSVYKLSGVGIKHGTDIVAATNAVQLNSNATAASVLALFSEGMATTGTVNDASATTTSWICAAGLVTTDDHYNSAICLFTSGTNLGLCRQVIDWDESENTITTNAWPVAPANADTFAIFGKVF